MRGPTTRDGEIGFSCVCPYGFVRAKRRFRAIPLGSPNNNKKREKNVTDGRYVKVYDNNVDKALRILKRKVNNDNTLKLLREREFFVSRGERRRREKAIATRRYAKKVEKANLERSSPPRLPRFE